MKFAPPWIVWSLVATCVLCAPPGLSASDPPSDAIDPQQLVRQLGDPSFEVRQQAAERLRQLGNAALPALSDALDEPDPEIRLSAGYLIGAIRKAESERRLTAFLEGSTEDQWPELPGWERFASMVGSDRAARELFVDMLRRERSLLEACEAGPQRAAAAYIERIQTLQSSFIPGLQQPIDPGSLAALLLAGTDRSMLVGATAEYQMFSLLNRSAAANALTRGPRSEQLRKLLEVWLDRCSDEGLLARNGMMLALRYQLKDIGLKLARKLLTRADTSPAVLPYAILTVGKFGSATDAPLLVPMLQNKTVCHSWHNGNFRKIIRVQVRDVALATLIHLTGQDPKDYGFEFLQKYDLTLFHIYTCGFADDTKREAALAKWRKWSAAGGGS